MTTQVIKTKAKWTPQLAADIYFGYMRKETSDHELDRKYGAVIKLNYYDISWDEFNAASVEELEEIMLSQ